MSIYTTDSTGYANGHHNPDLHISLFSSPIWPTSLKTYFQLDCHRRRELEDDNLSAKLDEEKLIEEKINLE